MPTILLPASAAAFAPRAAPNVVLNSKVEPWLTATLKRINRIKRPLNSAAQHTRCLTEALSSANAIWSLCSIMLPKAPDSELRKDENPLVEALLNYQLLHIDAYVVHVDMVSQNEVAFKLTPETIQLLVEYHKEVFSVDAAAATWNWSEKEVQLRKLQEEFVQAANKYIYRTNVLALEGLEEEGAGELLRGRSDEVRDAIMGLFVPLLPPPPRMTEIVRPAPLLPSSSTAENWWPSQHMDAHLSASSDSWGLLPSSPSPVPSSDAHPSMWAGACMNEINQLPSPTPSYGSPYSDASCNALQYFGAPPMTVSIPPLPMPSMLTQQHCSSTAATMGSYGWDRYPEYTMPFATAM